MSAATCDQPLLASCKRPPRNRPEVAEMAPETQERHAEIAYEAYAPVYDLFTAHYDTEGWLSDLLPHLERHGLSGNRLLDVGCGTGESFIPMLARCWEVTGCDISPAMLEHARSKAGELAELSVADMRELPRFGSFDLVWALDDAINYLLSPEELAATLAGMRSNLSPGGLVMFDLNTLLAYRTFFAERHVIERDGMRLIWTGQAAPDVVAGSICEARFEAEGAGQAADVRTHLHRQRHFSEADVLAALASVGLDCLAVLGHGLDGVPRQPLDEAIHTKAIYIAKQRVG
jgi:SAM-dependent methyltransferase